MTRLNYLLIALVVCTFVMAIVRCQTRLAEDFQCTTDSDCLARYGE